VALSSRGTFGEPVGSHGGEHLVGGVQLPTGVGSPVLPAQPFPVQQVGAGEMNGHARAGQPLDRLAVEPLGSLAVAQQRT
jgi:hypothetical protein